LIPLNATKVLAGATLQLYYSTRINIYHNSKLQYLKM